MKKYTGKISTRPRNYRAEAQASTLASKLRVENGNVVFAEDLRLPDYDLDWQEACLFALVVDDYKNGNYFLPELVVGRFDYFSLSQVYFDLHKLKRKDLIFNCVSGGWYPAWAFPIDIFKQRQDTANLIKAIDFLLKQEKGLVSENRLLNILDFIIDNCSGEYCTGCKHLSEDKETCLSRGDSINCRNSLLERISNGTLKPNGKGGAQ